MALGSTIRQAMVNIGGPGVRAAALGFILGLVLTAGAGIPKEGVPVVQLRNEFDRR